MHITRRSRSVVFICAAGFAATAAYPHTAEAQYQKPPAAIERLLAAPPSPTVRVSPDSAMMLVEQTSPFPTIAEVAEPRYRLAGIRFSPVSNGPSNDDPAVALSLHSTTTDSSKPISGLPAKLRATHALWSPDSKHIALVQKATAPATGSELWIIDLAGPTAHAHRAGTVKLNAVLGAPCAWMPDSTELLCKTISPTRGTAPKRSDVPAGPDISENLGKVSPAPTYEDMLATVEDESIFEYYTTSQLATVSLTGTVHPIGPKALISSARPSPDGHFALIEAIHRPFSYTVPWERFPTQTAVVSLKGTGPEKVLFDRPTVDNLPISRDAVETGPRQYGWRSDVPATLYWVEAADGGDPTRKAAIVDVVKALPAPFTAAPVTILEAPMRLARGGGPAGGGGAIEWGNDHLALATEARFSDRKTAIVAFDPSTPGKVMTLYAGSSQDRYHSPGRPVTTMNAQGHPVLKLTADAHGIYFISPGASAKGDQPFVGVLPVAGGKETILTRSADPYFTDPIAILNDQTVLVRRESATESPNYFTVALSGSAQPTPVTHFPSPYAGIDMPTHQLLKYKRADGVDLTATLWLPAGYNKSSGPLPTLMEAYPAEFKTRSAASQVAGSPNRFPRVGWGSPIFFTQTGYAVLENAAIPIIGEGDQQPNDSYVEQLVAGAQAAINAGVGTGTVDAKRMAVMGHSYGAFMTANLLVHTNLFRAGIARSGAYNRSLTPYGFQNEERTYWQDPKLYFEMSPFSYADKMKTPLLMIHGGADDNTGTYPIQSERFYAALKGQGATVRLVFLPLEAHHYVAHESLDHMLWEMNRWLDTYVKPEVSPVATKAE